MLGCIGSVLQMLRGALMEILYFLRIAGLWALIISISGCGGESECHDCDGGRAPESRLLDVSGNIEITNVESYFSMYEYGPTQRFYHFTDEQAVIVVRLDNASSEFEAGTKVTLSLFDTAASKEGVNHWINNQYSDALYGDAAEPINSSIVPADKYSITAQALLNHTTEFLGNEYDNYMVELYVDNVQLLTSERQDITIIGFTVEADVHVLTKDVYNSVIDE